MKIVSGSIDDTSGHKIF